MQPAIEDQDAEQLQTIKTDEIERMYNNIVTKALSPDTVKEDSI